MGQDQSKGMTVQSFTNSIAWDDDSKRLVGEFKKLDINTYRKQ